MQYHINHLRIPAFQADELPILSLNGAAPARIPHGAILVDLIPVHRARGHVAHGLVLTHQLF